ncbi:ABC transporter ATP-binding protein [Ruminiclostridium cellobioparum]|uniref:ABC transporter ATP-binding protein n=1 Tax=Ruminiclostridium cellobioparum TaxID=29355 RepID=UPI00047FDC5B|nr:ABC transporter ATP-binding protein [Ruminiclostridium cellobioparum]
MPYDKAIEVIGLHKVFKLGQVELPVLCDVNLNIYSGEFISIMGASGSGKSTLLYLIGGLDNPTSGQIKIKGKSISSMKDKEASSMRRKDIGFIFQFYNLIPNLNVEENIMLSLLLDGKREKFYKKELDEIIHIVGLESRMKHKPRELSGGEQQRVAIARALINSPDIILADEPIGNLDSKTGTDIMNLLQRINREKGKTIIQVTHSMESVKYGDRIVKIKDGIVLS